MDYSSLSAKRLIKECQKGKTKAFEEIMLRDSEYVYGWIIKKTEKYTII